MGRQVSYFSMEAGISPEIKTYSGGLGVLAGDTLKSAADHGMGFTAVTMLYRNGYFRQRIEDGKQFEEPQNWNFQDILEDTGVKTSVELRGREVTVKVWRHRIEGEKGYVDVFFLDTGLDSNHAEDQALTDRLYMGGQEKRLCQEAILGIAGTRALNEMGVETDYFHMNEGHSALLTTEADGDKVFTTHTPVPAGHDTFRRELVERVLPDQTVEKLEFGDELNMTRLALENSSYANGVSDRHAEVSRKMFPDQDIDAVTNGVHSETWTAEPFKEIFDSNIPRWKLDPARLTQAAGVKDSKLWKAKQDCKAELSELIQEKTGETLDPKKFTVGFARRSTEYKRPALIFRDLQNLEELAETHGGLQLVFSCKAHPEDTKGKEIIAQILKYRDMMESVDLYFIENYSMKDALKMVSGVDLWLNNPRRGQEASGTSGMKAAHNGTPQLSTPDGWWLEGCIEGVTGWTIGKNYVEGEDEDRIDSQSIYTQLDKIMSIYNDKRQDWINIMKNCITLNASHFNTDRMLKEYLARAYN
ncbi:MAG: alpha-glucan family phosphorylase [Candidatus Nanosalina sp.]